MHTRLHRFSRFVAACTVLLILAGSLVTSHQAGLSVPDWPTSYGWNMFMFPPSMWIGNIFYEHGHRLIATTVGFLTVVLVGWLWLTESRAWLRWFGVAALGAVVVQGLLGGITVLFFLPALVSTAHAGLAEIFFCMTVAIALFTSPAWIRGYEPTTCRHYTRDGAVRRHATTTTILVYVQILIGAAMRHTGAGLAIPDFPLMFGGIIPDHWSPAIAVHFAHRVGALVVCVFVVRTARAARLQDPQRRELKQPLILAGALVGVQITLGPLIILSRRDPWFNSLHVVCGALVLATMLVVTLRAWRGAFEAMDALLQRDWPGNVRELRNIIERATIMCEDASIRPEDLVPSASPAQVESTDVDVIERRTIERVMRETDGNKAQASHNAVVINTVR